MGQIEQRDTLTKYARPDGSPSSTCASGATASCCGIRKAINAIPEGTELVFTQAPIFDPRSRDGWRGAFKRLGLLLQPGEVILD